MAHLALSEMVIPMVNKIFVIFLLSSIIIGCGLADYSQPLMNGYYYNDWGRHFITYKDTKNNELIVIDSEVINYQIEGDLLLVSQIPKMLEEKNKQFVFWLVDTKSREALKFEKKEDFILAVKAKGLSITAIDKLINAPIII